MTWYRAGNGQTPIQFTKTKIVDNTSKTSTLSFSEDYHNYDLLLFRCVCSDESDKLSEYLTTPDIIDEIFTIAVSGSLHVIQFNENANNHYVEYNFVSNTEWTKGDSRYLNCIEVYGITCNKTITATTIYQRGSLGSTTVEITSQDSLFQYDLILGAMSSTSYDEIKANDSYINLMGDVTSISEQIQFSWNKYNQALNPQFLTEYKMSSGVYFMVQGIRFT